MESKSDPVGSSRTTTAVRRHAPTRETVAWNGRCNYDRTSSLDPFDPQQDHKTLSERIMAKEAEIDILRRQIEGVTTKRTNNLASPGYFPGRFRIRQPAR